MFTWYADGADQGGGVDPFTPAGRHARPDHPRAPARERQPRRRPAWRCCPTRASCSPGERTKTVDDQGLHLRPRRPGADRRAPRCPPVVSPGQSITFRNDDSDKRPIYHTITACKEPCNKRTGIAYPLANGPRGLRLGRARLRPALRDRRGEPRHVEDAEEPQARDVHVLLPRPPVHARRVPRQGQGEAARLGRAEQREEDVEGDALLLAPQRLLVLHREADVQ